jgi:hypothetical protein
MTRSWCFLFSFFILVTEWLNNDEELVLTRKKKKEIEQKQNRSYTKTIQFYCCRGRVAQHSSHKKKKKKLLSR